MISLAKIFFYIHTALCFAYVCVVLSALGRSLKSEGALDFGSLRVGNLLLLNNDRVVDGVTYLILGLFLLYAEIYMYRVYSMALAFQL